VRAREVNLLIDHGLTSQDKMVVLQVQKCSRYEKIEGERIEEEHTQAIYFLTQQREYIRDKGVEFFMSIL